MNQDLATRVIAEIASVKRIPEEDISLEKTFEELGIDSLDAMNLLFALEEEFGISISDEEARGIRTVHDACALVERYLAAKTAAQAAADGRRTA